MGRNKEHKRGYDKNRYQELKKDENYLKNLAQKRREWRALNVQRNRETQKRWKLNHPEQVKNMGRDWWYRKKYGITLLQYNKLLVAQNGACLLCGRKTAFRNKGRNLFVDHNHKTGRIRGLLCSRCNTMIGHIEIIRIKKIIKYLSDSL